MSDAVLIAVVGAPFVALITGVFQLINKKADRARDEVNQNTAEVEAVNKALEGMTILMAQQRTELDRKDVRIVQLEHDLEDERAVNVALDKLNQQLRQGGGDGQGNT